MTTYRIVGWEQRYEVSAKGRDWTPGEPKRLGPLQYVRLKVHGRSQGVGWRKLLAVAGLHEAPTVFGIFCKLLEMAADAPRDKRGFIEDSTETPLAFVLGLDPADVQKALDVCCDPRVGWMVIETGSPAQATEGPAPSPKRFKQPIPQEVAAYAASIHFDLDGQAFCDHYAAKGWVIGTTPMQDWKAAVRTWKRGKHNDSGTTTAKTPGSAKNQRSLDFAGAHEGVTIADD